MCHLKLLRTERVLLSSAITRNEGVVLNIHKNRIRVFEHHYVILKSKKNILIRSALPTYGANKKLDLGIYIMKANVNERSEIYTPTLV